MPTLSLHWNAEQIWQQLHDLLPGLSVEILPVVASTNTALLDRARVVQQSQVDAGNVLVRRSVESGAFGRRAADVQPALLVAEHQAAGRGRQGRGWESAPGASLTFSLGLPMAVSDWAGLSLAVGVALSEAIDAAAGTGASLAIGLKWPNDLWLVDASKDGRKLGGVLIETVAAGAQRFVVVGVGLNVQPFRAEGLSSGFASAQELLPDVTAPDLLGIVTMPLVKALKQFETEGFRAFADRFALRDVLRGRAVRSVRGEAVEGIAAGVSEFGALLLETESGLKTVASGEVSVRPAPGTDRVMLRALVLALLLANLGFFAWTEGWLDRLVGPSARTEREPERLQRQVRPDSVRVIPPGAAMPAASAAQVSAAATPACLEAGPMEAAKATAVDAALKRLEPPLPSGSWTDEASTPAGTWLVYIGRFAGPEALAKKEEELRRRRLDFEVVRNPVALAPGLSLGRYPDRAAAEAALAGLGGQDIRTARVVQVPVPAAAHLLRFASVDAGLSARVAALQGEIYGGGFKPCAAPSVATAASPGSGAGR